MKQNRFYITLIILFLWLLPTVSFAGARLSDRSDVRAFIQDMVNQYHFNGAQLVNLFNQVQIQSSIIALMTQPKEANPWYRYQTLFITQKRIDDGVTFWNTHAKTLAAAQQKYGVPASVIVAILGVETHYGTYLGKYRVIDALSTLAFDYPPRANFFKSELAQYLLLAKEQHFDPLSKIGSYAGAIGAPQFMPSSYRKLALSSNGRDKIDLANNPSDAIYSVANYFKNYGWQAGKPVIFPAKIFSKKSQNYVSKGFVPKYTWKELSRNGIRVTPPLAANEKACLIQLQGATNNQYWLGLNNFYVITQYNPSLNYAMAVYQLGQQIQAQRNRQLKLANADSQKIPPQTMKTNNVNSFTQNKK